MTNRTRKLWWWILGAVGVVAVLAVAGPFLYIHFVEGPAPAKLHLPLRRASPETSLPAAGASPAGPASAAGTWNVGPGSVVGYRVDEVLIGQQSTAVGRTTKVWGSLTISGQSVTQASFTADMASVESDQSERNAQFDGRIMDVNAFPTARFILSDPISLGPTPANGVIGRYRASGELMMHGVTRPVTFTVSAERLAGGIDVLADIPIAFSDWNISNPSIGGFVATQSSGTLEALLDLTAGPGNPASTGPSGTATPGSGGPVTVPSTTVPPLTVPSS